MVVAIQAIGPKYTALKPIDTAPEGYTSALALVADMEEVRWMLYLVREQAVANIVGKPIDGLNVQVGVIMAVAEIERQLHEAKKRYAALVNQKEYAVGGAE
jgi:hypothetical protein